MGKCKIPFYGQVNGYGNCVFAVNFMNKDSRKLVCKTYVQDCSGLQVSYDYTTNANTFENSEFKEISRKEFFDSVKAIQAKHNVKFTIVTN